MYVTLSSDRKIRKFLKEFIKHADAQAALDKRLLPNNLVERARSLQTDFISQALAYQQLFGKRRAAVAKAKILFKELQKTTRDFWGNIKRRARREGEGEWRAASFKLHISQPITRLEARGDWMVAAEELLAGEAAVVAEGGSPSQDPSAADLTTRLDALGLALQNIADLVQAITDMLTVVNGLRSEIFGFHQELASWFRHNLRKMPAPARRQVMRAYGFSFTTRTTLSNDEGAGQTDDVDGEAGAGEETDGETTGEGAGTDGIGATSGDTETGDGGATEPEGSGATTETGVSGA